MQADLLLDAKATVGESPAWDATTQTLYWVDILEKRIYAGDRRLADLDNFIGCLAPCDNGHLILGVRFSFVDLEPNSGQQTVLASLDSELPANRFNDGKCDPAGRLLAGTMDLNEKDPTGSLYSFDGNQTIRLLDGITISNGLAWSPDYKTLYYIDTPHAKCRLSIMTSKQVKWQTHSCHWIFRIPTSWHGWNDIRHGWQFVDPRYQGGAQVTKWDPKAGKLLEQIPVHALHTSSCVFGGRDMNELYVTTARKGLSDTDIKKYPLSGGIVQDCYKNRGDAHFFIRELIHRADPGTANLIKEKSPSTAT